MSRKAIIDVLPEHFVNQMRNWAKTSDTVGHYSISQAYEGMPTTPVFGSRSPATGGEASHIQRALDMVPNRERLAVRLFWLYEGADLVALGTRLHVDYRTVETRIRKGHEQLREHLARLEGQYERMIEGRSHAQSA